MTNKVKWGILGAAGIARRRVLPAMLQCELAEVAAVGSRSLAKSQEFAEEFSIPTAYGSYEELINDPEIEVIYSRQIVIPSACRCLRYAGRRCG